MSEEIEDMNRRQCFEQFMRMFAGPTLTITQETQECIRGELRWPDYTDDVQEVRWDAAESKLPSRLCFQLVSLIADKELLDIDMISASRQELFDIFQSQTTSPATFLEFESALEELQTISVARIDDGEESDSFFVHE